MSLNATIKRGIAFMLLLVFLQQMGVGLFIHNLLHDKTPIGQSLIKKNENAQEISFSCNCVDNFLMPFEDGDELILLQKPCAHSKLVDTYTQQAYFTSLIFSTLRGPPVFIG